VTTLAQVYKEKTQADVYFLFAGNKIEHSAHLCDLDFSDYNFVVFTAHLVKTRARPTSASESRTKVLSTFPDPGSPAESMMAQQPNSQLMASKYRSSALVQSLIHSETCFRIKRSRNLGLLNTNFHFLHLFMQDCPLTLSIIQPPRLVVLFKEPPLMPPQRARPALLATP
jgi:hypothetical protein